MVFFILLLSGCVMNLPLINNLQKNEKFQNKDPIDDSHSIKSPLSSRPVILLDGTKGDSDADGINDHLDQCPNTKHDTIITWNGCPRNSATSNPRYIIKTSYQ